MTIEARSLIQNADIVLSLVADPLTGQWIEGLNENVSSLQPHYAPGKERLDTYHEMVEVILDAVRAGNTTCAVFYGHPGVFVYPTHLAIRTARNEGFAARMLPAISAEDCLFADLGVDPARSGCLSFEATSFLIHGIAPNPAVDLILWQVGVIGRTDFRYDYNPGYGLGVLQERLSDVYSLSAPIAMYEASHYPLSEPRIDWLQLGELSDASASATTTLYVPHEGPPAIDTSMLERLDMMKHASSVSPLR